MTCRSMLGLVFLVSASSKVRSRPAYLAFTAGLVQTTLVTPRYASAVGAIAVVAEVLVFSLLVWPPAVLFGYILASGTMAVLLGGILVVIRRKVVAPCLCFGTARVPLGRRQLVRNAGLFTVANLGLVATLLRVGSSDPMVLACAGIAGAVCGSIIIRLDDLVFLLAEPESE
ncbi:MauE/DoxX family redox-associated membrane protein [Micromonospora aurantiaca]|uniref:MauE/DoxX family redox-associated membrane protein n=1 Tax=Micromonospora aurantiaca (nom. illeg.) TaxID=47850 RepID=UPI003B9864DF